MGEHSTPKTHVGPHSPSRNELYGSFSGPDDGSAKASTGEKDRVSFGLDRHFLWSALKAFWGGRLALGVGFVGASAKTR